MKYDLHDYYVGKSFDAWKFFGAHVTKTGCVFRVYAPNAKGVSLIGEFSDWEPLPMKQKEESGIYELTVKGAKAGQMYKYRIYFEDGNYCDHSDPFAFSSELRPGTASVIADLDFKFDDSAWMKDRTLNYNKPMNIYEVHLGSWRRKPDGSFYTYEEIAEPLTQYIKDHHFTHVEFMPLTEHPVDESWGYQVLGFYSATSRYGTPEQLQYLINTLHDNGIGVILDFVPVHFALDYYGLARFDGSALYEYPHDDTGYSEWGSHNFNFYRGEVRSFLQSAIDFWIENYHVDGIRLDAISNALYWQGNKERGANEGAISFIQEMNLGLKERYPTVMKIAEDSTDYLKVTAPVVYDGLGFDYKWDLGWMNDTLEFLKYFNKYDRGGFIAKIQWSMFYFYNELYLLPFSHDEVVHGKGSIIDKMNGSYDEKFQQARMLYMYMMTHPGKKLNFMGNEIAQFSEWSEQRELDWMLLDYPVHQDFEKYITALNKFYLDNPCLWKEDYNSNNYKGLETTRWEVIAYERFIEGNNLITILNFDGHDLKDIKITLGKKARLKTAFRTQDYVYFAENTVTAEEYIDPKHPEYNRYSFHVDLPPFAGIVLEVEDLTPKAPAKEQKAAPELIKRKDSTRKLTKRVKDNMPQEEEDKKTTKTRKTK